MLSLSSLPLSASMEMTKMANQKKANGEKVISLSIGDNHFDIPSVLNNLFGENLSSNKCHYTDGQGVKELRESIADNCFHNLYTENETIITPGVKQGMFYLLAAIERKRIAVIEPTWLGYSSLCTLTDKTYIPIDSNKKNWIEELNSMEFEALILCSPNNPNGNIYTDEEFREIKKICDAKDSIIIVDEIYKAFIFEGTHDIIQTWYGSENVFVFNGFSKSHAVTGLRIGYCLMKDQRVLRNMVKLQQNIATCPNSLAQYSLIDSHKVSTKEMFDYYKRNRDIVSEMIPSFSQFKPKGGFYYFISLEKIGIYSSSEKFCMELFDKYNVATVPGKSYGTNHDSWFRLSYCIDRDDLKIGLKLIRKFIKNYEKD